jgi:hypothetical protein
MHSPVARIPNLHAPFGLGVMNVVGRGSREEVGGILTWRKIAEMQHIERRGILTVAEPVRDSMGRKHLILRGWAKAKLSISSALAGLPRPTFITASSIHLFPISGDVLRRKLGQWDRLSGSHLWSPFKITLVRTAQRNERCSGPFNYATEGGANWTNSYS